MCIRDRYKEEFTKREENIETLMRVFLVPDESAEIRQMIIKNHGILKDELEIYSYIEPILSKQLSEDVYKRQCNNR